MDEVTSMAYIHKKFIAHKFNDDIWKGTTCAFLFTLSEY